MSNFAKAIAAVVKQGPNMQESAPFESDYTPPPEGPCRLRFVGYVELGKHSKGFQGKFSDKNLCELTFEVSGPKYPPVVGDDGVERPILVYIRETLSLNEKARFYALFQRLNWRGEARHISQLLGDAYKGRIVHREYTRDDGSKGIAVELYDKKLKTYTIEPPLYEVVDQATGEPTGETKVLNVAAPISKIRLFLWDFPDTDQWASIFIEGEYPERKDKEGNVTKPARSKNMVQEKIRAAKNFKGSPIAQLLGDTTGELAAAVADALEGAAEEAAAPPAPKPAKAPVRKPAPAKAPSFDDFDDDIPF